MDHTIDIEQELASLLVETLHLEGVAANQIDPVAPLFGEGLGLDSLDMLELSMAIEQKYGIKLRSDDPDNRTIFASLRSLGQYVQKNGRA
ncbi:phosphopantetheine-binding protein [Usitatibacter palustris]|uniref:Acyl carrier protein n=1 Tax=Usitatibacter palustris TaxID=2732487 RepID=A0A6M4H820_9PROT|nr:phosphopantetheine-binding protein [Usitatibacter palustris]QJR15720.1 Acyl carrier protein [Usitatibacter palustris]